MLLDVIHTIHQFVEDVPEKLKDFKKLVHSTFPRCYSHNKFKFSELMKNIYLLLCVRLIDTKTLATQTALAEKLETSTLEPMVKCLQDSAFGLVNAGKLLVLLKEIFE
jgi:hypothetical protein